MADYVEVEGLPELIKKFRKLDKQLSKNITDRLRVSAKEVALTAKGIAASKGFAPPGTSGRGTGSLIAKISYSVRAGQAYVKESANRSGFSYPAVYEFGHGKSRSFMEPARDLHVERVYQSMEDMITDLINNNF